VENIKIDANAARLLLVEGRADKVFSVKLLEHMGISDDILIDNYGGEHNLKNNLLAILNNVNYSRNRRHIGIVRDANYDTDAFASAVSALEHANRHQGAGNEFSIPPRKLARSEKAPYVSVLIVPSDDEGALEDLIVDARKPEPVMSCVDEYFDCLTENGISISKERLPKNKLSVFISGAAVDADYTSSRDLRRKFLREAVAMQWWRADLWQHDNFKAI